MNQLSKEISALFLKIQNEGLTLESTRKIEDLISKHNLFTEDHGNWIIKHHETWLYILSSKTGKKILLNIAKNKGKINHSKLTKECEISRPTFYKWYHRIRSTDIIKTEGREPGSSKYDYFDEKFNSIIESTFSLTGLLIPTTNKVVNGMG